MRRIWLLAMMALTAVPAAAEAPYLPLEAGRAWHYDVTDVTGLGGFGVTRKATAVARVGATRTIAGQTYRTVTFSGGVDGRLRQTALIRVAGDSVELHTLEGAHTLLLPGHLAAGAKQTPQQVTVGGTAVRLSAHRVGTLETVRVPQGTHRAVPVSARAALAGSVTSQATVWYARGVGPVKIHEIVSVGGVRTERTLVLRKVVPGKGAAGPTTAETPTPRPPTRGGVAKLAREIVAVGGNPAHASWSRLKTLVAALGGRATGLGRGLPVTVDGLKPMAVKGHSDEVGLDGVALVSSGDVSTGRLTGSVVIVDGDLTLSAQLKGCLVVCTGDIAVAGYLKDCVVVCTGDVSVDGYVKQCLVEAGDVAVDGYSKSNVWVNIAELTVDGDRKGDRAKTTAQGLAALLR